MSVSRFRRRKAKAWEEENPLLERGEPGYETDTGRVKVGDGINHWNNLDFVGDALIGDLAERIAFLEEGGSSQGSVLVYGDYFDMASPTLVLDCAGKTAVNVRRVIIPSSYSGPEAFVEVKLKNLADGTPYQINVENQSLSSIIPVLYTSVDEDFANYLLPIIADKTPNDDMFPKVYPNQKYSVMGIAISSAVGRPIAAMTSDEGLTKLKKTANYSMQETDYDVEIEVNSGSPVVITMWDFSNGIFWEGMRFVVTRLGVGAVTIQPPSGMNLRSRDGTSSGKAGPVILPGRYSRVEVRNIEGKYNEWVASGPGI